MKLVAENETFFKNIRVDSSQKVVLNVQKQRRVLALHWFDSIRKLTLYSHDAKYCPTYTYTLM